MSNDFYNHGSFPTTGSAATSASMRAELDSIAAGFDKMPTLTANANEIVVVNSSATGLDSIATLPAGSGGTGFASYAVGDLLYASTTTALSKLADVATGNALISGGVGIAPSYGKIGLTTHVSGTLPVANGGTGITSFGTGVATALGVNVGTAGAFVVNGGALGTPSSGTLTNATGLPLTSGVTGTLPVANGGTGLTAGTSGGVLYYSATGTLASSAALAASALVVGGGAGTAPATTATGTGVVTALGINVGTAGAFVVNGGALGTPSSGTLTNATGLPLTTGVTGVLDATNGGTDQASYAVGDLLYANTTTSLAKLADVATGNALISGGVGVAPSYGKIGLTTHVSGTLPVANGGTGLASGTSGGVLYYSAAGTLASSAALTANALVRGGGAGAAPATITTGTGVITALGVAVGSAGAFVVNGGALGTPSSGTVTNLTGTASININGTVGATTANTGAFTTLTASANSSFTSTGALLISKGTTGEQPGSPATGMMRYNTTTNQFEGYSGSTPAWKSIGGSALSNDTSTTSTLYPVFAGATTGTAENLFTSNAKLLYKPSTGEFSASVPRASNGIFASSATITASYTVATGDNAMSAGVITIANGVTVTVSDGSRWTVV